MADRSQDRFAILLGRDAVYPAPIAFDLAHELGHIMLGHLHNAAVLIDDDDPVAGLIEKDDEEAAADAFALELLTGAAKPDIRFDREGFGGRQLARAARAAGRARKIEPGTLALCAAHQSGNWKAGMAALRDIYTEPKPVWREVNELAEQEINWGATGHDSAEFLQDVMGLSDAA